MFGINGLELFDYLFGIVMFLDWNRVKKGRALAATCRLLAMLLGNAIRITSFVVLGTTASRKASRGFISPPDGFSFQPFFSSTFPLHMAGCSRSGIAPSNLCSKLAALQFAEHPMGSAFSELERGIRPYSKGASRGKYSKFSMLLPAI